MNERNLAETLSARFRLGLTGSIVSAKDGTCYDIRVTDIPSPNGSMIQVMTGWKSIEADFVPDTYAGDLVRAMGNSPQQAREVFVSLASTFDRMGYHCPLGGKPGRQRYLINYVLISKSGTIAG